jgi:type IV secretion system protein VirB9
MMRWSFLSGIVTCAFLSVAHAQMGVPIVSDSRIKTLVYNPNDVYSLLTHYGYQSNVEFGPRETVQTISVGDRIAWKIVPAGNRLFIKAMEEGAHTNMTVVTNKRAYQFDLRASNRAALHPSEELVYVVRFFYPDANASMPSPPIYSDQPPVASAPIPRPVAMATSLAMSAPPVGLMPNPTENYRYTLSGPEAIAPVKIHDDGRMTYFQFRPSMRSPMQVFIPQGDGRLLPVNASRNAQCAMVVAGVQPRFVLRAQGQQVVVYNESMPAL